jgi:hypothetical protein
MSKMASHEPFGCLQPKLWAKERPGVKTASLRENDSGPEKVRNWPDLLGCRQRATYHWKALDKGYNFFLRSHCNQRSVEEVMRPQSPGSPCWQDFGTPTRESQERKAIWMPTPWRVTEYTIRGKVVTSPSPGCGESCVSVLPVARPSTKGAPTMH